MFFFIYFLFVYNFFSIQVNSFVTDKYNNLAPDLQILKSYNLPVVLVFTFLQFVHQENRGDDNGALPQSPREIKARMLSAERIQAHLKNATAVRFFTCKDLNYVRCLFLFHLHFLCCFLLRVFLLFCFAHIWLQVFLSNTNKYRVSSNYFCLIMITCLHTLI